jgi:hypothetical protein
MTFKLIRFEFFDSLKRYESLEISISTLQFALAEKNIKEKIKNCLWL